MRDEDETEPKPKPPVAPEESVASRFETLPEEVDAPEWPLPPLAFEELQTANAGAPTKTGILKNFFIFIALLIAIANLEPG